MDLRGAPNTDAAVSPQGIRIARWHALGRQVEPFLEAERSQMPLWSVVAFGAGIAAWFWLPTERSWLAAIGFALALVSAGIAQGKRAGRVMFVGGALFALGTGWIWLRAEWVAAPTVERITVTAFTGEIEKVEPLVDKGRVRLTLAVRDPSLPPRLRVSLRDAQMADGIGKGASIRLRARLMPPPTRAVPGAYDFSRKAWFAGIGGVGTALGDVDVMVPAKGASLDGVRRSLGLRVRNRLPGAGDGVATALVTGDKNAVAAEAAEHMRRSGLAHLLAVSGLHIAAVVGAAMLLSIRLLALSERLALRFNLVIVSAAFGAVAGIGYTVLTGMQVPTVRACIAALLVLGGLAIGRDALSLRLVAVGALLILLVRPESIVGASFQLSFAAVTAIIALHGHPAVKRWIGPREENIGRRFVRGLLALLLTGLAVEITLMPLALYHFHKAGLYGVLANIIAIPLTTFVVMPLLALALLFDAVGLGAPFWWLSGMALELLLALAEHVSTAEGAVASVTSMPTWGFAACILGGLWIAIWRRPIRWLGLPLVASGLIGATTAPIPDLLVTGDGRHLAINDGTGPVMLRTRTGDYMRDVLAEASGFDGDPRPMEEAEFARCNRDACTALVGRERDRGLTLLATRSRDFMRWEDLVDACRQAEIVVSDRWLPKGCTPKWLKLDRKVLERSGGVAVYLGPVPRVESVEHAADHPWHR